MSQPTNQKHCFFDTEEKRKGVYGIDPNFCCNCHQMIPESEKTLNTCTWKGYYAGEMFVFTPYVPLFVG